LIGLKFLRVNGTGITICKKHGRAGLVEFCPHVADVIASGNYCHFHRIEVLGTLLVCSQCLRKYGLEQFERRRSYIEEPDDGLIDAYEKSYECLEERRQGCAECVAAAEVAQARKDGKPDPFPVYERTLTANQQATLYELKACLLLNFKFQPSVRDADRRTPAMFLAGGNYRWPMTLTIYYITVPEEQDRIASLVANFLRGMELNQGKIIFFEAEVCITKSNYGAGTSHSYRGHEVLLREIYLNR
jgi:hypothetical protein